MTCRSPLNYHIFFTYYEPGKHDYYNNIYASYARISAGQNDSVWTTDKEIIFKRIKHDLPEKNWLPFIDSQDNLLAIRSCNPLSILSINNEIGDWDYLLSKSDFPFEQNRNSAGPVPYKEGYLMVVHKAVFVDQKCDYKNYYRRFIYVDKNFNLIAFSDPFVFCKEGIEFSCGMTLDHEEKSIIIGVGIDDREAYLYKVPLTIIDHIVQHRIS